MTTHASSRCGHGCRCRHGNWADRHPTATVALAVLALTTITAHQWLIGPAALAALALLIDRERTRREATAARADRQHATLLAAPLPAPRPPRPQHLEPPRYHPHAAVSSPESHHQSS